jgi:hypothetical protein
MEYHHVISAFRDRVVFIDLLDPLVGPGALRHKLGAHYLAGHPFGFLLFHLASPVM